MRVKASVVRVRLAQAVIAAYGQMTYRLAEWYARAGAEGLTDLPFKDLWQVFRRDAGITSASEQYGSLYVTLQRLVQGKPSKPSAGTESDASDEYARAITVLASQGHLLDRATVKVLAEIFQL